MGLDKFGRYLDVKRSNITSEPGVSKKYIEDCLNEINDQRTKQTESILAYQNQMIEIHKQQIINLISESEERIKKLINNLEVRINDKEIKNKTLYSVDSDPKETKPSSYLSGRRVITKN